ncbi:MAG TPA: ABC transporter ATP-binding protein [Chromatiaceae bacterium]|nr:ABC transporter ATP-binding protein [Chromatiaceae bacterium]
MIATTLTDGLTALGPASRAAGAAGAGVAVRLQGLGRRFGAMAVVADLDLEIPPGQFLALLGPSGCGKTTLLRLIAGLDTPDRGAIRLEGDPEGRSRAYVFQDACLLPWRRVLDNVALPLELGGVPKAERREQARRLIQLVGLEAASERYPDELSGGMKMRVSLARALITRPRLLLLDEPFAALDDFTRQHLDDHLQGLFLAHGMTVVFVTHSMAEAVYLADRVVMLAPQGGGLVLDQRVDLPRPRDQDTRVSPGYAAHIHDLATALARWAPGGVVA